MAHQIVDNLASGQEIPNIQIIPQSQLKADGAFGNNTIYISQDLVNSQQSNFSQVVNVLLEEMGHYIDSQINIQDAPGDEGAIFAKLVQNQPLAPGELITLKAEDDHGILNINGQNIAVEHADTPGVFLVDNTGRISIDFLADSGSYHNEMAIFSLENMDSLTPGSADYIKEAARRALSNSTLGYTVIIDINEGAKFVGEIGESNKNDGNYSGLKTFSFTPGDKVAFMLVPEGTVQKVFDNPNPGSSQRPLFSIAAANPNNATQIGQLVPGTFGWEDIRNDQSTDADYNDIIFKIQGANGTLTDIGGLFASGKDWRNVPLAQEIITFASQSNNTTLIAKLSQDTGISNLDIITNNPEISGSINNADNISKLQAKFTDGSNFVDILSELKANGSFVLNKEKLAQIKGGQIADGDYQLNLRAEDKFGNISEFLVKFTLDTTKPGIPTEVGLKNDGDRVTNQNTPTITGNGENGALIELFDGQNKLGQTTVVNGFWEITTSQITDGLKKLTITATDISGNPSDASNTEFTIDSALPQINITNPQTNAILNPGARLQGTVNGTGSTIDKLSYRFGNNSEINVPINNQGAFDVELNLTGLSGQQNLIIKAVDLAVNSKETTQNVVVNQSTPDTTAPSITASLNNDTGINTDGITFDSTITGTVTDISEITTFQAKLNSGNFVDVLAKLQNGNFTLDTTTLTQINGGQLPDGTYQLTFKAEDKFGNVSSEVKLGFTLDTTKPAAATELKIKDDTDAVTKNNTPIISGQAETGTKVQIFDGQTKLGETTSENGVWEITTSQLTDGVKNLTVITTDIAGNVSDNASLSITVDTVVPDFNITTPQANGELTTGARLQGTVNGTGSTITQLTYRFNNGSEINVPVNGQGAFDVELNLTSLSGQQNLILSSLDLAGNSTQTTINVTINSSVPDTTPPTVIISSTPSTATSFVELTFNEPVQDSSFTADKYSLKVSGGTNDGQTVVISSVEKLSATLVRLNLAAAFTTGNYKLTVASGITDIPGNATTTAQNFDLNIAAAPLEISPTNGEEMVGLNRETVVRFGKKIDPTTVKDDSFYLIANGQRIAGEIKVSSTEEFATFFYANPLPASTEVRVVVDGSKIIGRDGVAIDGNLDGLAGGIATADFTTLPITRIQGTDVWGYVYDSYNKNPDGSNIPIKGVTIRLDALPDVFAVTDDKGYFILKDVPAPDFYVYIDGSTATGAPAATQYASLGKPFHSVPGQSTQLFMDGLPFNVYLPPMAASDVKALSTTEATQVGFGEASQAFLEELFPNVDPDVWTQVQVTFNPGSAQDDGGNAATQAMIIPVDPQRLPAPLPPGVNPQLVISIQAGGANGFNREADGGATNFDVPAPIQFPNLEGLQPGEKSLFWSFDHDAGKWIVIGTGTVSEDGKTIKSDPGVGVLAPGWHFTQPGSPTNGPKKPDDDCDPNFFTLTNAIDLFELVAKCAAGFTGLGAIVSKIFKLYSEVKSLINNTNSLFKQIEEGGVDAGTIRATFKTINSVKKTVVATFSEIKKQNPLGKALAISKCLEGLLGYAASVCDRIRKEDSDCDTITVRTVCRGLDLAKATLGKTNGLIEKINKGLDDQLLALACGTLDQIAALVGFAEINENRVAFSTESNLFLAAVGDENDGTIDIDLVKTELQTLLKQMEQFQTDVATAEDFLNIVEDTTNQVENLEDDANNMYASTVGYTSNSFYLIEYGDFQLRGKTDSNGQFDAVLPPSTDFSLSIYDSVTNRIATYNGQTSASGIASSIPAVRFVTTEGIAQTFERIGEKLTSDITDALSDIEINGLPDTDGDGLVNAAERIIGTVLTKIDTDNDGINDLVEIQQGLDPLGGQAFPTGIISSLPLQGEANAVTVAGSITNSQTQTAYVATGSYGLAVVNASQFNNPVILGQLDLPGNATDVAVDTRLNIAAVASNSGGLHLVNVADGMLPSLNKTIDIDANQVEIADGIAYATVNNVLYAIDLATGEQLQSLNLPGSGTVTGLARERTTLYAFVSGSDTFSSIDITDEGAATVLGQLNVNVASSDVGLSVSNGIAYLAGSGLRTINVSNPSSPTLISDADNFFTARGVTLNGSGLALVSAEDQGLAVYSITDPQNTNAFLTVFNTPGFAYNAAIASGIAFLADGSSGLQVINYLSFDNKGQAPTININTSAIDLDPNTAGIQVQEGTTIPILADILDDVQVRNVELLVNGTVISNDVSFPWDLSVIAPAITPDKNTVDIQVRATDTGGNTVLSNTLTLNLKEDIFAPTVLGTTPSEGARRKEIPSIAIRFNEALDTTKLNLSGITLTNLGADGVLGGGDDTVATLTDLQTRNFDRTLVILTGGELPLGEYQLKVDPSIISDLSGNALANSVTLNFTKRPLTRSLDFGNTITGSIVEAGEDEVYTFNGTAGQRLYYDGLINNNTSTIYSQLISPSGQTVFSNGDADSDRGPFTLTETGTYKLIIDGYLDNTGDYSFRLLDASAATTITLDTTITDTLTPGLETDIYRINGTAGQRLFFDSLVNSTNATWRLYNPGNGYVTSANYGDFETTLNNDGTYLLVLSGYNNDNTNYSFKVTNPPTTTTTLTLGNTVTSTISQPGEIKEYTFNGTAGQRLYYDGLINNNTSTIYSQLISPSGQTVFSLSDADSDRSPFTLTETGTYKLIIDGYLDNTGDYSFRLIDASAATNLALNTQVAGTLDPGLETAIYRITGTAGQKLRFDSLNSGFVNGYWTLYKPGNQYVTSYYLGSDFEVDLPGDGTYLLVVGGYTANETVNYKFQITEV